MPESDDSAPGGKALGTIPLKQVRVTRTDVDDPQARAANPMNRLVPYLDLFSRLTDAELARLAVVAPEVVAQLRGQVQQVDRGLKRYIDLLPRLTDDELVRLTGATNKTIRFWRLCQPRDAKASAPPPIVPVPTEADAVARALRSRQETAPHPVLPDAPRPHPIVGTSRPLVAAAKKPGAPTPPAGTPAMHETGSRDRVTPGLGSPAFTQAVPHRPTPPLGQPAAASGTPPAIEIEGTPFPGFDYDPNEPIPDDLSIGVDLPDPY